MLRLVIFAACATAAASEVITASHVCVYNDAAFVLKWHLRNADNGASGVESKSYPVWQTKCMSLTDAGLRNVTAGASVQPVVKAVWGKEITVPMNVLYDPINASQVTYVCKGTTLDFSCSVAPPPPTVGNVTKAVGEFIEGFVEGLGADIGFTSCLNDINGTFSAIKAVVDFFESGINMKTLPAIAKAFHLIGDLVQDFSFAITECVKDAGNFAAKMKEVAGALKGNLEDIIKVLVTDAVHIWQDRTEITADCKSTVAFWRAGDYKGAGKAVGDIVGIIIDAL